MVVSAGPEAAERDVSTLRTAIHEVFEARKASLLAERQHRASVRLVPRRIALLEQMRGGLLELDDDFASRKKKADDRSNQLDEELRRQRRHLDTTQEELRRDVRATCDRFRSEFIAATNDPAKEDVSRAFHTAIEQDVRAHLTKFGKDTIPKMERLDAEIQRVLKDIDKATGVAATIATAALTAAILPFGGMAASATEAVGGATMRHAASRVATETARVSVLKNVLKVVHDLNPINMVSDLFAEWWKEKKH